jgi:RNA polymerase primary sigma factor
MGAQPVYSGGDDALMRDLRRQVRTTRPLQAGEQEMLLERSARGDRASLERLVEVNLGLVIRLAEAREAGALSVPDLVQEGSIGLVEAVRSFAKGDAAGFVAFAERKVGEQMDAAIAAEAAVVRDAEQLVTAANDYERTEILLHKVLQRAPTEAELAEKLEWTVGRTRYVAQVVAEARRRHDEELLAFIDPEAVDPEAFADDGLDD